MYKARRSYIYTRENVHQRELCGEEATQERLTKRLICVKERKCHGADEPTKLTKCTDKNVANAEYKADS